MKVNLLKLLLRAYKLLRLVHWLFRDTIIARPECTFSLFWYIKHLSLFKILLIVKYCQLIHFKNEIYVSPTEIYGQICEAYDENAMSKGMMIKMDKMVQWRTNECAWRVGGLQLLTKIVWCYHWWVQYW